MVGVPYDTRETARRPAAPDRHQFDSRRQLFSSSDTVDLVLLGGAVHHKTGVTLGSHANEMLASLNVQKAF